MADPFSTFAGAVSTLDVAIRSCKGLYDASHAYKNAPQESEQLRGTIRNTESILRNTRLWVAEYRASRSASQFHEVLPEAVKDCVQGINTSLNDLSDLLPSSDESRQITARSRWVLHKKKIKTLLERLAGQKESLDLCLQTVAQRSHVKLHTELEEVESLQRKQLEHSDDFGNGQHAITLQLDDIMQNLESSTTMNEHLKAAIDSVSNHQIQDSQNLDKIKSTLTRLQLSQGSVDDNTVPDASTVDLLVRIIRTELRESLIPTIEGTFQKYRAVNDQKLDSVRQAIDLLSADVGRKLSVPQESPHRFIEQEVVLSGTRLDEILGPSWEEKMTPRKQDKRIMYWAYNWRLNLRIGQVRVHVTTRTKKKAEPAQAYEIQQQPYSREYSFTISFLPSQYLLMKKGFALLYNMKQDHRSTYAAICPSITFFNVVTVGADVMQYAGNNNVDGIKRLFTQRRASPHDRTPNGTSVLEVAAGKGRLEMCQLLLDQGADHQSAQYSLLAWALIWLLNNVFQSKQHENFNREWDFLRLIRLLLNKGFEFGEGCGITVALSIASMKLVSFQDVFRQRNKRITEACCALRELGLDPNSEIDEIPHICHLLWLSHEIITSVVGTSLTTLHAPIAWFCELGVDVNETDQFGYKPLHVLFCRNWSAELSESVIELAMLLLDYGADPCALDIDGFSVLLYVAVQGWEDEFAEALSRCDIKLIDVVEESERRLWPFFHPVAESTAVEDAATRRTFSRELSRRKGFVHGDREDDSSRESHSNGSLNGDYLPKVDRTDGVAGNNQLITQFLIRTFRLIGFSETEISNLFRRISDLRQSN